jgi:hypothetical protein
MRNNRQSFPIDVRTGWLDYSPALRARASQHVRSRLAEFASEIRSVTLRFSDDEPLTVTHRRCDIEVMTTFAGPTSASSVGHDLSALVDRALETVVERLRQGTSARPHADFRRRIA